MRQLTVEYLRQIIAGLPGDLPVLISIPAEEGLDRESLRAVSVKVTGYLDETDTYETNVPERTDAQLECYIEGEATL